MQEAKYIIDYFPRLMTVKEKMANKHQIYSTHLGQIEDYENKHHNVFAKNSAIELALKSINGIRKEDYAIGLDLNIENEKLVEKYLTKSAKNIMIIKR